MSQRNEVVIWGFNMFRCKEMCCDGLCGSDQGADLLREAGIDEGRIEAICGPDGVTALGAAASHGHLDTMRLLLESKSYTALQALHV